MYKYLTFIFSTAENGKAATAEPKTPKKRGRKPATPKGKKSTSDGEDDEERAVPKKRARKTAISKGELYQKDTPEIEEDDEQQVSKAAFDDGEEQGQKMVKDEPITS